MLLASIVATYVGTLTVSSRGAVVLSYSSKTSERVDDLAQTGLNVHDETLYSLTVPPPQPAGAFDDILMSETSDSALQGAGPSAFTTHITQIRRTRSYSGSGRAGYGKQQTFDATYHRKTVARVEHEITSDFALGTQETNSDTLTGNRSDLTTTIAADGSFERKRLPIYLSGYNEVQQQNGAYRYTSDIPGFSSVDNQYTPVVEQGKLTGIAFHRRTRGRTIGIVPFTTTDGITKPAWLTLAGEGTDRLASMLPSSYDSRTLSVGALIPLPAECTVKNAIATVVPSVDVRHSINTGGTTTDVTTASYYNGATLECRISDTHVVTYDVITNGITDDMNSHEVRALQSR